MLPQFPYPVDMTIALAEGRRVARKRETRRALHDAALRLFIERGFQETTVADIARAAGVAPRTFFGYFPTKEAALYGPLEDLIELLESRLSANAVPPDALDTFREWVAEDVLSSGELEPFGSAAFRELATNSDGVAAYGLQYKDRVATALAQGLRTQWGYSAQDSMPEAAAGAVVTGLTSSMPVGTHLSGIDCTPPSSTELLANVDRALAFARAGIAAVRP